VSQAFPGASGARKRVRNSAGAAVLVLATLEQLAAVSTKQNFCAVDGNSGSCLDA